MKPPIKAFCILFTAALLLAGAETYQKPPEAVLNALNAPATPELAVSPAHLYAIQATPVRYPPIAELAQPMLRLAGIRINPRTNGLHNATFYSRLVLRKLADGAQTEIAQPSDAKPGFPRWSPDGAHFAFTNTTPAGIELWVGDLTGKTHCVAGVRLNGVLADGGAYAAAPGRGGRGGGSSELQWLPDGKGLLVEVVNPNRAPPPAAPTVPTGPDAQESRGGGTPVWTHEDMLESAHDEDLFEYYATSQLARVDLASGKVTLIGRPGIIDGVRISPDAQYLLVTMIQRPFSYLYPYRAFPKQIEVWDRGGRVVHRVAACRWKIRCRSTACRRDRDPWNGDRAHRLRCYGSRRWTAATCANRHSSATASWS